VYTLVCSILVYGEKYAHFHITVIGENNKVDSKNSEVLCLLVLMNPNGSLYLVNVILDVCVSSLMETIY